MAKDDKELVPVFGSTVSIADSEALLAALDDTAADGGRVGDISFMSFSGKTGNVSIGVDKRGLEDEEPWLVAVPSFELGWMCWKGGKPLFKRMANVSKPRIPEPDPQEGGPFDERRGEGWARARAITMKSFANGEQVYFSNNSKSGVAGMSDLQREVVSRMKEGQPAWPVVVISAEEFTANDYKNYKPVFEVIKWLSSEEVESLADPDVDPMSLLDEEDEPQKEVKPEPRKRRTL